MNIMVIAGYDVLADKIPDHQHYVKSCCLLAEQLKIDLLITIGGATNPDYPQLTEAEANYRIIKEKFSFYIHTLSVVVLPFGHTSADTLKRVKDYIEIEKISVNKLVLCAEQSRLAGFLLDALYVKLLDLAESIIAYGYPFPDSKKDFISQRRKMLMKVLSHHGSFFARARRIYQRIHQKRVAKIKRKQEKSSRL